MIGTETELRNEVARIALSFVGTKMGDSKHKKIIDSYNSISKQSYTRKYQMSYTDPYCITACSMFAMWAGIGDVFPVECGCYEAMNLAQGKKDFPHPCWIEDDAYICKKGDVIVFAVDKDENFKGRDNKENPYHVMVVVEVDNIKEVFRCVSPNDKNHETLLREIAFDGKNIRGFIAPKYQESKLCIPEKTYTEAIVTTELNMRTGPGVTYGKCNICLPDGRGIRHTLRKGEKVKLVQEKHGWWKIEVKGEQYTWYPWISGKYVRVV